MHLYSLFSTRGKLSSKLNVWREKAPNLFETSSSVKHKNFWIPEEISCNTRYTGLHKCKLNIYTYIFIHFKSIHTHTFTFKCDKFLFQNIYIYTRALERIWHCGAEELTLPLPLVQECLCKISNSNLHFRWSLTQICTVFRRARHTDWFH